MEQPTLLKLKNKHAIDLLFEAVKAAVPPCFSVSVLS